MLHYRLLMLCFTDTLYIMLTGMDLVEAGGGGQL